MNRALDPIVSLFLIRPKTVCYRVSYKNGALEEKIAAKRKGFVNTLPKSTYLVQSSNFVIVVVIIMKIEVLMELVF